MTVRYRLEISTDRDFGSNVTTLETTGLSSQPTKDLAVSATAPVGARYYWRVRACVEAACSEPSPTWWVNVGRTKRDINGDGFADIVLTASGVHGSGAVSATAGRLHLYLGGAGSQFDATPDSTFTGAAATWFRRAAAIGDFNADGFSDVAVQVTDRNNTTASIHIYLGGAGSFLDPVADHIIAAANCFALGDVNGDGFDDLAISTGDTGSEMSLVYGGRDEAESKPFRAARVLRGIGDTNGDGFADVIDNSRSGEVLIFQGGPEPLDEEADGKLIGSVPDGFGGGVSGAGDINGDGFADMLVGAPRDDTQGDDVGRAFAYLGGGSLDSTPDAVYPGAAAATSFGMGATALGDINGDGFDDVAVRFLPTLPNFLAGGLRIFLGTKQITATLSHSSELIGNPNSLFGKYTAAGDLNGDGFQDLVVGAPNYSSETTSSIGLAYVYFGGAGSVLDLSPEAVLNNGEGNNAFFGTLASDNTELVVF